MYKGNGMEAASEGPPTEINPEEGFANSTVSRVGLVVAWFFLWVGALCFSSPVPFPPLSDPGVLLWVGSFCALCNREDWYVWLIFTSSLGLLKHLQVEE